MFLKKLKRAIIKKKTLKKFLTIITFLSLLLSQSFLPLIIAVQASDSEIEEIEIIEEIPAEEEKEEPNEEEKKEEVEENQEGGDSGEEEGDVEGESTSDSEDDESTEEAENEIEEVEEGLILTEDNSGDEGEEEGLDGQEEAGDGAEDDAGIDEEGVVDEENFAELGETDLSDSEQGSDCSLEECLEEDCAERESCQCDPCGDLEIVVENNNEVDISNEVNASSNTGDNSISEEEDDENQVYNSENSDSNSSEENEKEKEEGESEDFVETEDEGVETDEEEAVPEEATSFDEDQSQEVEVAVTESENEPENLIETGDALVVVDLVNEVNINIVGDNWFELLLNIYGENSEDIDLLEYFEEILNMAVLASFIPGVIINQNDANIDNEVVLDANTGNNAIGSNGGYSIDSAINTGDAQAISTTVNMVNLNIVGNNWVFAVVNVFGDWTGDLIVPGLDLLTVPANGFPSSLQVLNENELMLENNIIASADTGDNEIFGSTLSSEIVTGQAIANSSVLNIANTNIVSNNWLLLNINDLGNWFGQVVNWEGEINLNNSYSYDFEEDEEDEENQDGEQEEECCDSSSLSILNQNSATVVNDISVSANTGGNQISGAENGRGGEVSIETGNASAMAQIINFINTNIIGSNWLFIAVNVLGSWTGDIEFAYPDLAIEVDDDKDKEEINKELSYDIKIENQGKAKAKNVKVGFSISKPNGDSEEYDWLIDEIESGEEKFLNVDSGVGSVVGMMTVFIEVSTETVEKEMGNNRDSDETEIYSSSSNSENNISTSDDDYYSSDDNNDKEASLRIKRVKPEKTSYQPGDILSHSIKIKNDGEEAVYDIDLKDKMKFSDDVIVEYIWSIGDLDVDEAVIVEYQLLINAGISLGDYEYSATAKGEESDGDDVRSGKAKVAINIFGNSYGLGEAVIDEEPFVLISTAQAKDNLNPFVMGSQSETCGVLPWWIWILAVISYTLAINWAFFPINTKREIARFKSVGVPIIATLGAIALWSINECIYKAPWFIFAIILSFIIQLYYKNREQSTHQIS